MRTRGLIVPLVTAGLAITLMTACGSDSDDAVRAAGVTASPSVSLPPPLQTLDTDPDQEAVKEALVGLTKEQAEAAATAAGYNVRVTSEDGQMFPMTMDFRTDRINIEVENGVVTGASIG